MKSWKKKLWATVVIVVLIILAIVGVWWSRRGQVTVQTGKVVRQDLTATVTASGQIEPENYANVNANSIGKVTAIYVQEGEPVKKGQLLMRTDDVQQQANVDAQRAMLKSSEATLAADEAAVEASAAAVRTAQANVIQSQAQLAQKKLAYQRGLALMKDQLLSKQDFDQRISDYKVAEATVQSSTASLAQVKAQYVQAKNTRAMASAQVAQNRASLMGTTDVLDKTIYTSPYNGIVTSLPVHVGENVVPGVQNQTGSLLFQVSDLSLMNAEVLVDETDIASINLKQPAYISVDALPNQTLKGYIEEIGQSAVSSTTGETTTAASTSSNMSNQEAKQFKVKVRLEDPPSALRPGLSCTARIITAVRKNAISIPIQALTYRSKKELEQDRKKSGSQGQALAAEAPPLDAAADSPVYGSSSHDEAQGVFVVRKDHAVFVPVETGIMGTMNVEVLNGLEPGDVIVTGSYSVLRTLRNNAKIRINNTPPPSALGAGGS
ncbi:MAG: efflux RND transporter periplasmic adaptor subunit [Terriglobia bacterium]